MAKADLKENGAKFWRCKKFMLTSDRILTQREFGYIHCHRQSFLKHKSTSHILTTRLTGPSDQFLIMLLGFFFDLRPPETF